MEETLQCEKDGYSLVTDGHNIPWQSLWGYRDSEIIFTIDMPIESYDRIREFWEAKYTLKTSKRTISNFKRVGRS